MKCLFFGSVALEVSLFAFDSIIPEVNPIQKFDFKIVRPSSTSS